MNLVTMGIGSVLSDLIGRFFPDKSEAQKAQLELAAMIQKGEIDNALQQIAINIEEAKNPNLFVSAWRPFLGWSGGVTLVYHEMVYGLLVWLSSNVGWTPPPKPDGETLIYVLGIILGVGGGLRTVEKINKVAR